MSTKLLNAVGVSLALAGAAALPLQAVAQEHDHAHHAHQPAQAGSTDSLIVVRDADGKLRAPTAEEHAVMAQAKADKARNSRVAPQRNMQRFHKSGARGARLTDESMSASIAILQADGTLVEQCFESKEAAEAAMKAGISTTTIQRVTE